MQKIILTLLLFATYSYANSQTINDLTFGTAETFEVVSWNIEWFPKKGETTINYVKQIVEALDADVIAIQEIDDKAAFKQMADDLVGWESYYIESTYLELAYLYKTSEVENVNIYEILTSSYRELPRSPLVMELTFDGVNYVIINNHYKCCGNTALNLNDEWDEETRRYDASVLLKDYIDTNFPDGNVLLVGDLNDLLNDKTVDNVFQPFLNDDKKYRFLDMEIAAGNSSGWSYPSWPSHLDHILITNDLFDEMENEGSEIKVIKIGDYLQGGFTEYDNNISDHRPIAVKIAQNLISGISDNENMNLKFSSFPNPIIKTTKILFPSAKANTKIEIYTIEGQKIQDFSITKNQTSVIWNAEKFPNGIYFGKLIVDEKVMAVTKMMVLKM